MSGVRMLSKILLASALALLACDRDKEAAQSKNSDAPPAHQSSIEPVSFPEDSGPLPQIDSARAMQYVKEIVKFGPRSLGSPNHKKVEDDTFTAKTPVGDFPVHNIIAKFPGTKDGIIVVASHYDTNYPLRNTSDIGAN